MLVTHITEKAQLIPVHVVVAQHYFTPLQFLPCSNSSWPVMGQHTPLGAHSNPLIFFLKIY